jgi:small subunit ribosomal protein S6
MAAKTATTRAYEGVIIIQAETPLDAQKELFRKNKKIIEDHKGSVVQVETWGRRTLGNPIHKNSKGVYFHTTFYADPQTISELERTMRINDRVLRFVHTRLEEGTDLNKFNEEFKRELAANAAKEREREAKLMEKRAAAKRAALEGSRGDDEE